MLMPFAFQQSGTVAAWTPLSLGNTVLYGWYKADAGVSVSTDGASVGSWNDQSGNGRNLAQATAINQPTFRTAANGVNGIPVLQSAASTTKQEFINTTFPAGSGFSAYFVMRMLPTRLASSGAFGFGGAGTDSIHHQCQGGYQLGSGTVVQMRGSFGLGAHSTNYSVQKVSHGSGSGFASSRSTFNPPQDSSAFVAGTTPSGFQIGSNFQGSCGSQIAEVIMCTRDLTIGEEISLDGYYRSRYGFGLVYGVDNPVAGAALWIDGSRWDTLFGDYGVTGVIADNAVIRQANDLSGNGLNATQTIDARRPTYRTPYDLSTAMSITNGLSAIQHNSTGWYLQTAAASLGEYTAFAVMTSGWVGNNYNAVFGHNYSSTTGQALMPSGGANGGLWSAKYLLASGNGFANIATVGAVGPYGNPASQSIQQITAVVGSSGSTVRLNGTSVTTIAGNQAITPSSAIYYLGNSGTPNDYHDGKTCETIIYPRILSSSEISQVEAYLKAKWNTP